MKKEYDFSKMRPRPGPVKVIDPESCKIPVSIRLDGSVIAMFKGESLRTGIPYQTLISSVLFRYMRGELVEKPAKKKKLRR